MLIFTEICVMYSILCSDQFLNKSIKVDKSYFDRSETKLSFLKYF
jgi:hypothetical protein